MKIFDKSSKLEHVSYDIRGPILDEATRMIANGEKILRLNTGNPVGFFITKIMNSIASRQANTSCPQWVIRHWY